MTVSSGANRNDYIGNDTTAIYNYTFKIFLQAHLQVTVRNTTTDVETPLVLATDYTVTGVDEPGGGTIVLVNAGQAWISAGSNLDTGFELTIRRVIPLTQETDIRNQGDFFPEVHEDVFDIHTMVDQQQQDEIDRSAKLPETVDASAFDAEIPADIVGEDSVTIATNVAGTAFIKGPSIDTIAGATTSAAAAAASAAAAATSETNAATSETNAAASAAAAAASATSLTPTITGTRASPTEITAGTGIPINDVLVEIIFVEHDGGGGDITANPQIPVPTTPGSKLIIIGTAANPITLETSDGLDLTGVWVSHPGASLTLYEADGLWHETNRRA